MKALVTGATGFVGFNLVKKLLSLNFDVIATGNDTENQLPSSVELLYPSLIGINWNKIKDIDIVFHQGALNLTTCHDEQEMINANVDSTIQLVNHCLNMGCKRFVYASSTAVYGDNSTPYKETDSLNPLNPYGVSKMQMENVFKEFEKYTDASFIGLRYCNIYGPGEGHKGKRASMIRQLGKTIRLRPPKLFNYGEQKRDYIYVDDVVNANLLAAKKTKQKKNSFIVNCGSGRSISYNDVAYYWMALLKKKWEIKYIDNPYEESYQNHTLCDMSLAKEKLDFVPHYDVHSGIKQYMKHEQF